MAEQNVTQKTALPFEEGEVITFPCGGSVKIDYWGQGGICLKLDPTGSGFRTIDFAISYEALQKLPELVKRGLATGRLVGRRDLDLGL